MFRSASARQSDIAMHRLAAHRESWKRTAATWFDGTVASVDERLVKLDHILGFATDTAARLGSTEAGRLAVSSIPNLKQSRRELAAARDSLLNGFSDRQVDVDPAGRRTAKPGTAGPSGVQPDDPQPGEKGAPSFAEYKGKCTECGSDNVDHAYHPHSGEYDCSDCGATFHPKVRRLKSSRTAADTRPSGGHGAVPISPGIAQHVVPPGMDYPAGGTPGYTPGTAPVVGPDAPGVNPFPNGLGPENFPPGGPPPGLTEHGDDSGLKPLPGFEPPGPPPSKVASAPPSLVRAIVLGSRDFVADQNTDDREEILTRARRYAAEETSTLPVPMARRISAAFVGRVGELIANRPRIRQASRPITAYEDFDDSLMY